MTRYERQLVGCADKALTRTHDTNTPEVPDRRSLTSVHHDTIDADGLRMACGEVQWVAGTDLDVEELEPGDVADRRI